MNDRTVWENIFLVVPSAAKGERERLTCGLIHRSTHDTLCLKRSERTNEVDCRLLAFLSGLKSEVHPSLNEPGRQKLGTQNS